MAKLAECNKSVSEHAERFFYNNAGWAYKPGEETPEQGRMRGARKLAHAEAHAWENDWDVRWEDDIDGCIGCDCGSEDCPCSAGTEHESLVAVLVDTNGKVLGSLGSICGATADYRRVVEAELALDALA